MGPSLRLLAVAGALCAYAWPCVAFAGDMDLSLSRLRFASRDEVCTGVDPETGYCPDNEGFQRLASELAVAVSPNITSGAATVGPAGFYVGVSSTLTPIDAERRYWQRGTRGTSSSVETSNTAPAGALVWNRLEVRKGLPFGFEVGAAVGQGWDSSMWVFGGQLRWALLEGFRSGLGRLPRRCHTRGAPDFARQQPAVAADARHRPHVVEAVRRRAALSPDAAARCASALRSCTERSRQSHARRRCVEGMRPGAYRHWRRADVHCADQGSDFENDVVFDTLSHTRVRMFLGAEARPAS